MGRNLTLTDRFNRNPRFRRAIELRASNPCATLEDIGRQVGVTREYVRQILSSCHLPTRAYKPTYICLHCGKEMKRSNTFCSTECRTAYHMLTAICSCCDKPFTRKENALKWRLIKNQTGLIFCSKHCQGKWLSREYGFNTPKGHSTKSQGEGR